MSIKKFRLFLKIFKKMFFNGILKFKNFFLQRDFEIQKTCLFEGRLEAVKIGSISEERRSFTKCPQLNFLTQLAPLELSTSRSS